jgi:hypothetical protein
MPAAQTDESTLIMVFITAMVEAKTSKGTGSSTGTHLESFTDEAGIEAALSPTPNSLPSLNPRASGGGSAATTTRS